MIHRLKEEKAKSSLYRKTTRCCFACKELKIGEANSAAAMGSKLIAVLNSGAGAFLGKIAVLSSNNGVTLRKIPKKYRNAGAFLRKNA